MRRPPIGGEEAGMYGVFMTRKGAIVRPVKVEGTRVVPETQAGEEYICASASENSAKGAAHRLNGNKSAADALVKAGRNRAEVTP